MFIKKLIEFITNIDLITFIKSVSFIYLLVKSINVYYIYKKSVAFIYVLVKSITEY